MSSSQESEFYNSNDFGQESEAHELASSSDESPLTAPSPSSRSRSSSRSSSRTPSAAPSLTKAQARKAATAKYRAKHDEELKAKDELRRIQNRIGKHPETYSDVASQLLRVHRALHELNSRSSHVSDNDVIREFYSGAMFHTLYLYVTDLFTLAGKKRYLENSSFVYFSLFKVEEEGFLERHPRYDGEFEKYLDFFKRDTKNKTLTNKVKDIIFNFMSK